MNDYDYYHYYYYIFVFLGIEMVKLSWVVRCEPGVKFTAVGVSASVEASPTYLHTPTKGDSYYRLLPPHCAVSVCFTVKHTLISNSVSDPVSDSE